MTHKETCQAILEHIGGSSNIRNVYHCATRLRFQLNDYALADAAGLESIPEVLGTSDKNGEYQVILGPSVDQYFKEFITMGDFTNKPEETAKTSITPKTVFFSIVDAIAGSFNPILPAIIGCAMLKVIALLLSMTGILAEDSSTYLVLTYVDDAAFYFMPFLLAASAAKKFNCNPYLALTLAGFLFYPDIVAAAAGGTSLSFLGLPLGMAAYNGTVFPIISIVWAQSLLERFLDKYIPEVIKYLIKPLLLLLIMVPVSLCLLGPVTSHLSSLLAAGFELISAKAGWIFTSLLAVALPFLVPVGLHSGIVPLILNNQAVQGFDATFFPSYLAFHLALAGSGFAVFLKSRQSETKQAAFMGSFTTLLGGITEPLLFGVHLKLKRPYIGAVIGAGTAAAYAGIMKLAAYIFAFPCVTSILMWQAPDNPSNIVHAAITMAIAFIVGFAATYIIGTGEKETEEIPAFHSARSAADGVVRPVEDLEDGVFSEKVLGDGIYITPENGNVFAPCGGKLEVVYPTKHAYVIKTSDGVEILVHIGLDTAKLEGAPFRTSCRQGDLIHAGDRLCSFDLDELSRLGYNSSIIMTVVAPKGCTLKRNTDITAKTGDTLFTLEGSAQ